MFKVTVIDHNGDSAEYENVIGYHYPSGALHLDFQDGSSTAFAPGRWLEADVERVLQETAVKGDHQL